jgi:Uma2 family endonuclease
MTLHRLPATRPATYADVLDAPPHMVAEIVRGALHLHPRPAAPHARASSRIGVRLGGYDDDSLGPGGWWIVDEPELHLGPDVLVPDLAGWRRARMPRFPRTAFFTLAPVWVCEALSPGTRQIDLGPKRDLYGAQGVGHLWLVDPDARTLEAFARQGGASVLLGTLTGEAEVRMAPFEAAGFPLGALWPDDGDEPETDG